MKNILLILLLSILPVFGQNGVFTVYSGESNYELIGQGKSGTTKLVPGRTYEPGKNVVSINTSNDSSVLYFSNELIVGINKNSSFSVNSFIQETKNLTSEPVRAKFGSHILAATLLSGEASFVYSGGADENSSCVVSTPLVDMELFKGKFHFVSGERGVAVFVLEGSAKAHGERGKTETAEAGRAIVAAPIQFQMRGLDDKVFLNAKKAKAEELKNLSAQAASLEKVKSDVSFFVVDKKVIGINVKP